jgi:hypothetical protein
MSQRTGNDGATTLTIFTRASRTKSFAGSASLDAVCNGQSPDGGIILRLRLLVNAQVLAEGGMPRTSWPP